MLVALLRDYLPYFCIREVGDLLGTGTRVLDGRSGWGTGFRVTVSICQSETLSLLSFSSGRSEHLFDHFIFARLGFGSSSINRRPVASAQEV